MVEFTATARNDQQTYIVYIFMDKLNGPRSIKIKLMPIFIFVTPFFQPIRGSIFCSQELYESHWSLHVKDNCAVSTWTSEMPALAQGFFSCLVLYQSHPIAGCERAVVTWNDVHSQFHSQQLRHLTGLPNFNEVG
jgi:hypothetical protein